MEFPEHEDVSLVEFDIEADLAVYKTMSLQQLLDEIVGKPGVRKIPGMNEWEDRTGAFTPWDENPEAKSFFASPSPHKKRIQLSWHQAVGVHKLLRHMLKNEGILLADAVGVGKTLQAIALVIARSWFIKFHALHHRYPGSFGKFLVFLVIFALVQCVR